MDESRPTEVTVENIEEVRRRGFNFITNLRWPLDQPIVDGPKTYREALEEYRVQWGELLLGVPMQPRAHRFLPHDMTNVGVYAKGAPDPEDREYFNEKPGKSYTWRPEALGEELTASQRELYNALLKVKEGMAGEDVGPPTDNPVSENPATEA